MAPQSTPSQHGGSYHSQAAAHGIGFDSLFASMAQGVVYHEASGAIVLANPAAEEILGLSLDEMQGRKAFDPRWRALREDGTPLPNDEFPAMVALRTGRLVRDVVMGIYHPGLEEHRWLLVSATPEFRAGEDRPYQVFATFTDITERKRAEAALIESETWLRMAYAAAELGAWRHDIATGMVRFDERAQDHYGFAAPEVAIADVIRRVHPDDVERLQGEIAQTIDPQSGGRYTTEYRVVHGDGSIRWLGVEAYVRYEGEGEERRPVLGIGTSRDITERKLADVALRESEASLKTSQAVAHVGHWRWDTRTNQLVWSEEMYRIFGVDPASFTGDLDDVIARAIHPDDRAKVAQANANAIDGSGPAPLEYRVVWPDGSIHTIWAQPDERVTDGQGRTIRLSGIVQDITERKQIEIALRASEARFRSLFESMQEGFYLAELIYDEAGTPVDWRFLDVNPAHERIIGRKRAEVVGRTVKELFPGLEDFWFDATVHVAVTGEPLRVEGFVQDTGRYYENHYFSPQHGQFASLFVDITERVLADQKTRESEERFRQLANSIGEVFWLFDVVNQRIVYISPGYGEIWGRTVESLYANSFEYLEACVPDDRPQMHAALEKEARGERTSMEYRIERPDGTIRWIWDRSFPIFDEAGNVVRTAGVASDITERRQAEQQARAFSRLYAILSQINQAIVRIKERQALFQAICDIAIEFGGFRLAWIGRYDPASGRLEPVAEQGEHPRMLPFRDINAHEPPFRDGLIGLALRSGRVEHSSDIAIDARMAHWRGTDASRMLHAAAAIPLRQNGEIVGLLNLYAGDVDFFAVEAEQHLLAEIGLDISFALDAMRVDAERTQAEVALRSEQEKLARIAAAAPGLIYSFRQRPDGTQSMPYASPLISELFGLTPADVAEDATPLFAPMHPDDRVRIAATIAESARTLSPWHGEYRFQHPAKGAIWLEGRSVPIAEPDGSIIWHGFITDVTERKLAEQRLYEEQEKLAKVAASVPGLIFSFRRRPDGTFCMPYASPSIVDVYGVEAQAVAEDATPIMSRIHPDDRGPGAERIANSAATMTPWSSEFRYDHPVKGLIWIEGRSMPVAEPDGGMIWHGYTADITERKQAEQALRESNAKIETLFEILPVGISVLDANRNVVKVNRASEKILRISYTGLAHGEHHQRRYIGMDGSPFPEEAFASARVFQGEPEALDVETGIIVEDGSVVWVNVSAVACPFADWHVVVVMSDITARKQAELALRTSEEQYRGLVESLDSVVAVVDTAGRFLYMNEVAASQLGATSPQLVGRTMGELFPEPVAASQLRNVLGVIAADKPMVFENQSVIQGQPRWYRTSVQPLHDEQGRAVSALLTSTDITPIKAAQRELEEINVTLEARVRERTAQIQDLYDNAPIGYHSLDANGNFVMVNQTELGWLGYTHDEMIGHMSFRDILTAESQARFAFSFPRFKQSGAIRDIEFELIRKDGSTFFVSASALAVYDAQGEYLMSRSTLTEITERKRAEAELRLRQEELSAANAALAKAAKLKDEFLASMSHELRTPLTGILGLSEALQSEVYGSLNAKQAKTIHSIEESGRHLLNLINDILDLSKIEAGKLELEPSVFSVDELCQGSLRLVKQMAATKGQSVTYMLSPAGMTMRADPRRLKQAIVNLLSNAVKFTPDGGQLGLEVHGDAQRNVIHFSVWDKGIGIAPEDVEKLFKPFVQLDSGLARSRTGTGLGLSLVQRLAEMHGGSVTLESTPGEGSRFTLALPWFAELPAPADPKATDLPLTTAIGSALLVDDSPDTSELLATYLKELGIEQIIPRTRIEGAAEEASATQPAVIFLDIMLPDGSGWELLRQLKADERTRSIPVIVVSVVDDRPRAMQLGAADYLHKPVSRSDLQLSLDHVQRSRTPRTVEPIMMIVGRPPGYTILLAEDNEINRQLIQDYLSSRGYHVVAAVNGHEAVAMVQEQRPALVLMDIQMPGMDGLDATRAIRGINDPVLARVPIIALTALAMPGDRERCMTAGANAYLSKPVDLAALTDLISELIERRQ